MHHIKEQQVRLQFPSLILALPDCNFVFACHTPLVADVTQPHGVFAMGELPP